MSPKLLMFIRHAEKPIPEGANGVDEDGATAGPDSLSAMGWERAQAYVDFFRHPTAPIETPDVIFAAAADQDSQRPVQTVTPLAQALWPDAVERQNRFVATVAKEQVQAAAEAIMRLNGIVLVCWEHKVLPDVIAALLDPPDTPQRWPGHRFDVVWLLRPRAGSGWDFAQSSEMLLPGDEGKPIKQEE